MYFSAGVWVRFNGGESLPMSRVIGVVVLMVGWLMLACKKDILCSIGVPISILGLWYSMSGRPWPKSLTSCSFPIYVLHAFWGVIAAVLISAAGLKSWAAESAIAWGIKWLLMAGGSIITTMMARRFLPRMSAVVFGGR